MASTVTLQYGDLIETIPIFDGRLHIPTITDAFTLRVAKIDGVLAPVDSQGFTHAIIKPLNISGTSAEGAAMSGLDTGDSKLDQIISLLKAKTNPKARPISEVGSAEADSVLLELGFLQDDGNEVDPIVVPAGLSTCHSFDYSQFSSEDDGTLALLQHHQQQLSGLEVQFGRSQFQMYDIHHRKDLKLTLPSDVSYFGGLDGVAAPWGLAKAGVVSEMRIAYEHKQSSAQKQAYREANPQYHELTGTRLVSWTDLTPQQAYFKQAQWLAKPNATQRQNTLDSIPEDDALPLKKMRMYRPEAMALAQLSPELLEDLSPAEREARG
ncbi:TPA: hypothetical protein ACH3X1_009634 [Trebouxia sp. C0004]